MAKTKQDILKINRVRLNDYLSQQAATFYSYGERAEILHKAVCDKELELQVKSDEMSSQIRERYRNVKKAAPTETTIKAALGANKEIQALRKEINELSHAHRLAKLMVEAMKMRGEMLVSMAHNVRQEQKSSGHLKV